VVEFFGRIVVLVEDIIIIGLSGGENMVAMSVVLQQGSGSNRSKYIHNRQTVCADVECL
jgi:hypothetical protein